MATDYEKAVARTTAFIEAGGVQGLVRQAEAAAVRASVERGDPLAVLTSLERRAVVTGEYGAALAALADVAEPDPSQAVTAHPEPLDTQTDGSNLDDVLHGVKSDGRLCVAGDAAIRAAHDAAPPPFDRAAWLARVQRIDPRERRA